MAKTAPDHAATDRLACDAAAWLPSADPDTQQHILGLLTAAAVTGAEPIVTLRDGLRRWFGAAAPAMLPRSPPSGPVPGPAMPLEPLTGPRRPTVWPVRPKRIADELFSSWLWRCATASHVSPALFAADVLGSRPDDVDRDIAPETIRRLARLSGQTFEALAAGTLPLVPRSPQDTLGGMVEDLLMTEERLLLVRRAMGGHRRDRPIVAYCPGCLASDVKPYFRRRWRLAPFVICPAHRAMLLDRCWYCRSRIDLLTQSRTGPQPRCGPCGRLLCEAPVTPRAVAAKLVPRQRNLQAMLAYLMVHLPAPERQFHLRPLSRQFRTGTLKSRAGAIAACLPETAAIWFGAPIDPRHDAPLRMLARGVTPEG